MQAQGELRRIPYTSPKTALPADWDPFLDLLVVCGRGAEDDFSDWESGARIVFFLPQDSPRAVPRRQARTAAELGEVLLAQRGAMPRRAKVLRCDDPWADDRRVREVAEMLREVLTAKQLQANTIQRSGSGWLENALGNAGVAARRPSVAALRDRFAGRPAVLVSPGPSLTKNVEQLARLGDKALLISGTHSLSILAKHGITPDLVIGLDAGDLERHWVGLRPEDVPALAFSVSCEPEYFASLGERVFGFSSNADVDGWLYRAMGDDATLRSGGSVACAALSLAARMGCDPIVFVGQDLSFPDGRFYAAGGVDGDARVESNADGSFFLKKPSGADGPGVAVDGGVRFTRDQQQLQVPAYGGEGVVPTSAALHSFLIWFHGACRGLGADRVWNCTEGGARIEHTRELPLADALATWSAAERPFASELEDVVQTAGRDASTRAATLRSFLAGQLEALAPAVEAARRCKQLCREVARGAAELAALGRAEQELKVRLAPLTLLSIYGQRDIAEATLAGREARSLEQSLAASEVLFDVVLRNAQRFEDVVRKAHADVS